MILDPSVVIAILADEPESLSYRSAIASERVVKISAAGYLEAAIVLDRRTAHPELALELDRFLDWARASVEPITAVHARLAREAHRNFGRRSGHPARLNFGDCFSYALSIQSGEPLLFKGEDFAHTDVESAI